MILIFLWAVGGVMLMAGFIVQPRSQAPLVFAISFICLLIAALWSKSKCDRSKAKSHAAKNVQYDLKTRTLTVLNRVSDNEAILKIEDVLHLNFKYSPAELVYTGATTGNVSMGGFHINEASMSASQGGKTGKFCIVYTGPESKDNHCKIDKIHLSNEQIKSAKSHYIVSRFLKDDTLVLEHKTYSHLTDSERRASLDAYISGRTDIFYGLNMKQYVDMQLTQEECQAIVSWLLGTDLSDSCSSADNTSSKKWKV
jgi:hypothetical protein